MMEGVKDNKNEDNDNNGDKKNFPLIRRSISIISFISCEKENVNVDKINQN
jgi:hypothetical protein